MTMVLPLAFAACTSEEFESYDSNVSLAQRTEIGQVDLTFGFGDAQTRWDAGLNEEVADVLGAALIDAPRTEPIKDPDNKGKWYSHYAVQSYISTNYPYTYNGERWTSPAKLVEGSYMFYAPYAENHQVRTAIKYAAPVVQNLEVKDGQVVEMSAVADMAENFKSPFYFGYKFFDATDDNRNLEVGLRHIFAYPKFTLKNTTGEDVTITRIVLQSNALNIPASGEFDNVKIAEAMNNDEENWGADQSLNMQYHLTTASLLKSGETQVPTNLVRADLSEAVTIADDDEITFSIVMPAMEFAKDALTVYFVTESGQGYEFTNSTSTIELVPGRRYPAEDYNLDGKLRSAAGELLTKTIKEGEETKSVPYIVTSTQELINTIDATPSNLNTPLELTIGGDIEFNEDVLTAIAENLSQPVIFKGAIDIVGSTDATKPMDINQKVVFDEATVSGNVKLNNEEISYNNITVEEGASLEVALIDANGRTEGTTVIANNGQIVNNGTLTLKTAVKAIENNGTLNIETGAGFTNLTKKDDETKPFVNIKKDYKFALSTINGEWTVAEDATLTLDATTTILPYGSALTVDGKLNGKALTVSGTMNLNGDLDADVVVDGEITLNADGTKSSKVAKIVMGSKADVTSAISGEAAAGAEKIRDAQIVELPEDFVEFFGSVDGANLKVTYTYEGNVTENNKVNLPAIANSVTIDGSVAGPAGGPLNLVYENVKDLTITGNVQAINSSVYIVTSATEGISVTIEGDVRMTKPLTVKNASELHIEGTTYSTEGGGLKVTNVKKIYAEDFRIAGDNTRNDCWNLSGVEEIYLQGETRVNQKMEIPTGVKTYISGDIVIAKDLYFDMSEDTTIKGNVTISGEGYIAGEGTTISVAAGCTLTNRAAIYGESGGTGVMFKSLEEIGKTKGKVYNYGIIQFVGDGNPYNSTHYDWWHGNAAL